MPIASLLTKVQAAPLASNPQEFANAVLELVRAFAISRDEAVQLDNAQVDAVVELLSTLLLSSSTHFACLGYALASTTMFFTSKPSIASAFFSAESQHGRGAWLLLRPLDAAAAYRVVDKGSIYAPANYIKVVKSFYCVVGTVCDNVVRGNVPADALQPCLIEAIMADLTTALRGSQRGLVHEALAALQAVIVANPEASALAGAVPFLLKLYVEHEKSIDVVDLEKTLAAAVNANGTAFASAADVAPLFLPYMHVFEEPDARLLRARELLRRLPSSWPGLFVLASTEAIGLRQLAQLVHLPGSTSRRVLLIELFLAMLAAVAPHRSVPATGPWSPYLDRVGRQDQLTASPAGRNRTMTTTDAFDLLDDETEFRTGAADVEGIFDEDDTNFEQGSRAVVSAAAPPERSHHARDAIVASFLMLLNNIGLPDFLMTAVRASGTDTALPESAALLLQQVLVLQHSYLPPSMVDDLHRRLDIVVASAALHEDPFIGALTTKLYHLVAHGSTDAEAAVLQPAIAAVAALPGVGTAAPTVNPAQVKQLVKTSLVLDTTDIDRWNFGIITDLCRHQLRTPAGFNAARDMRLFDRLLNFYRPGLNDKPSTFAALPRRTTVASCGAAGMALLDLLLSSADGMQLLMEARVATALQQCLCGLMSSVKGHADMVTTMAGDYLRWLGHLTRSRVGLALLHTADFFDHLTTAFSDVESNKEAMRAIVNALHFGTVPGLGVDVKVKMFVSFIISSGDNLLRLSTVARLERFVKTELWTHADWVLSVLLALAIQGTRDSSASDGVVLRALGLIKFLVRVSSAALKALASSHLDDLMSIFDWKSPRAAVMCDICFELLALSETTAQLIERGWIDAALEHWAARPPHGHLPRWAAYCDAYDAAFVDRPFVAGADDAGTGGDTAGPDSSDGENDDALRREDELLGAEPAHICAVLSQTPEGAEALGASRLYRAICDTMKHTVTLSSGASATPLRGALFAVGCMSTGEHGHALLIPDTLLSSVADLRCSKSPGLRAAATTCLSMVARSTIGRERLHRVCGLVSCSRSAAYSVANHAISTSYAFDASEPVAWLEVAMRDAPSNLAESVNTTHVAPKLDGGDENIVSLLCKATNSALNAKRTAHWASLAKLRQSQPSRFLSSEGQAACTWYLGTERMRPAERAFVAVLFSPAAKQEHIDLAATMR